MGIQVKDVSYRYPTADARADSARGGWALSHVSIDIDDGDLLAVLGRNGSGKSTFCLLLNGLIPHFFKGRMVGEVIINGRKTSDVEPSDLVTEIGVVFQNPFDQLTGSASTVYDEVAIGPESLGLAREDSHARIAQALADAGITELASRDPFQLSGGQQQRVAIASVLAMRPRILVLDEPTSQLDPVGTDEVFEVVRRLHEQGLTIIVAEHKVDAIADLATRVAVFREGRVEQIGDPKSVLVRRDLESLGVLPPRCATLAMRLADMGIWRGACPLTVGEAKQGLREILDGHHPG